MKMKKVLSALLTVAMVATMTACGGQDQVTNNETAAPAESSAAQESATEETAAAATERPTEPEGQLIIGSITDLEGEFYDPSFNNTATNYKMYSLIHGYSTIAYTKEGKFEVDPTVVKDMQATDNEDGSKTYTFTLNEGLVWSDNSPVTAKDYVFALLLESSPEMMGVDGYPANSYVQFAGYDEFNAGETKNFSGVRLIDDYTFSVTVKAEELPYHYDLAYATVSPRPIAVIAPECDIVDSEEGASISGDFTTDLLMETINDPDTGYRYNPQVVCGPYKLVSYDTSSRQGTFEVNPLFAGDYRGVKPVIQKLIIKTVKNETQMNELESGSVDLLFSISGGDSIESGLDLVDAGKAQKLTYFRNGYGKIQFDCSQFPTDSEKVRQAIALCLDRNEFARQYSGGYASIVHAAYGLAQWEYQESKDWIDENLDTYEMDLDRAKQLLVEDGWTLNKDGGEYKDGDGLRYKDVDGELKPLSIEWCNTDNNPVSELLATMLPSNMEQIGMELLPTTTDFPTLSAAIGHQGEKIYNMYNLATGFASANSPWYYYSMDEKFMSNGYNSNWIKDQELADAAGALKNIPYDDDEAWLEAWRNYIKVWNEKLPDIPLYSDEYHDFFSNKLQGWDATAIWEWSSAVLDAWVTE
ncbi:MAG: ABC transporter substrate-binding protein [Eubacteriales bacterium]|nr:ABC transporter substrate-binding protein [Eubacteriales bacterium]